MRTFAELMEICDKEGEYSTDKFCSVCGNMIFEI